MTTATIATTTAPGLGWPVEGPRDPAPGLGWPASTTNVPVPPTTEEPA